MWAESSGCDKGTEHRLASVGPAVSVHSSKHSLCPCAADGTGMGLTMFTPDSLFLPLDKLQLEIRIVTKIILRT